jgi:hypothetical protein
MGTTEVNETQGKPKFTVKSVDYKHGTSAAEREEKVLAEEKPVDTTEEVQTTEPKAEIPEETTTTEVEYEDEKVLGFLGKKLNRELKSFDDLIETKTIEPELPADVATFAKYKKETGRGLNDFIKTQRDIDAIPDDTILRDYLLATEEGLDESDIEAQISSDFSYDEEVDDEKEINAIKRKKKKTIAEARKFFKQEQETYKVPLESKATELPETELEEFNAYKQRLISAQSEQEVITKQAQHFEQKTDQLFSTEFKGFKFKVDGKEVVVPFGEPTELKTLHATPRNFINKYLDPETGLLNDAEGYHRALAAAMNPEKLATFFYELGKAEAIESTDKEIKNINMSQRNTPAHTKKRGFTVKEVPYKNG